MNKDEIFKLEIDAVKKHLSGEKKMTHDELMMLGSDLEVDAPYSDDWISHGYSSYEAWFADHKDYLEKLDEVTKLYQSIPEVAEMRK